MAVGMMIPGFLSGVVQQSVGYFWLFAISLLLGIPGMIPIFFLPFENE
jgi:PAT family beta-lactamase induction signal transducer AmpG